MSHFHYFCSENFGGSLLFYFTFYCIFPLPFIPLRPPTPQECFEISMIYSHFALEDLAWSPPAPNGSSTCLFKNKSIQTFNCPQTSFRESTCALCAAARPFPVGLPWSTWVTASLLALCADRSSVQVLPAWHHCTYNFPKVWRSQNSFWDWKWENMNLKFLRM